MDLISRQAAIDEFYKCPNIHWTTLDVLAKIENLPAVDSFKFCDQLWKIAYERGKAEAHPRTGEWVLMSDCTGKYYACSWCGREGYSGMNYCPNCGARMEN